MSARLLATSALQARRVWMCLVPSVLLLLIFAAPAHATSGDLAWQRHYNGAGDNQDVFTAVARAPNGGVYVAGRTRDMNDDFLMARYSSTGRRLWLRTFNGPGDFGDWGTAAASDAGGNLVVAGYVVTPTATAVAAVIKYGPDGRRRWVHLHNVPTTIPDYLPALAVDGHGNIYLAGSEEKATTSYDVVLIKYSSSGTRRWVRRYAGPSADTAIDLALDGAGNVYITGYSYTPATQVDVLTMKFDPAGHRRWARVWGNAGPLAEVGGALTVTRAGTVYVAGYSNAIQSGQDALLLKYTTGGVLRWSRTYTGAGSNTDVYNDVVLLGNGDVAAVGWTDSGASSLADVLLTRYSPGGTVRWTRLYNGPDSGNDQGVAAARDQAGSIFIAGTSTANATGVDILTLKYNGAGALRWARRNSSAGSMGDYAYALAVVSGKSVYVAGSQAAATSVSDGVLLRYKP